MELASRPVSIPEVDAGCERGDATDCLLLGLSFLSGDGVPADEARARQLLDKACQKEHFAACGLLGQQRYMGVGGEQDVSAARPLLEKACTGGEPVGCILLGGIYEQGEDGEPDVPRARSLFERSCELGEAIGCSRLGLSLLSDEGASEGDIARAKALLTRGCEGGDGVGCAKLGWLALEEADGKQGQRAACEAFKKGCDAAPSVCQTYGDLCDKDFGHAFQMLGHWERGCADGDAEDCERAGQSHERGMGTKQEPARAAKLYARGCEHGSFLACARLADLEGSGYPGSAPHPESARQRLLGTCERKLPHACVSVGNALREGRPWLPRDLKAASGYYLRACEQDDAEGCEALALAYQEGRGVEPSGERAFENHRKACELGRAASCLNAGVSAEALKNREEAVRAYRLGCFRGSAGGCEALTRLGEATTLVERSQQVDLSAWGRWTEMSDLLFLPASPLLLASARGQLQLADTTTGQPVGAPVDLSSRAIQWKSPYGETTLMRKADNLSLSWDARAKEPYGFFEDTSGRILVWRPGRASPPPPERAGNDRQCLPLAYHSSGRRLLMAVTSTGVCGSTSVQEFDVETGKPVGPRVELQARVTVLASSADGSRYAAGLEGGQVRLIDAETGKVTALPGGHSTDVRSISFHPTRPLLATASSEGVARLWDLSGSMSTLATIPEWVRQVRFSPDGKLLAAAGGREGLLLLDAVTGHRASPPIPLSGGSAFPLIAFSPDGGRLAVADSGYEVLLVKLRGAAASGGVASVPTWFTRIRPLEPPPVPKPPPILMDGRIEGTVRFEGNPVPGAVVVLTPHEQEWDDARALGTRRYPVRPDGTFVLTNVPRIQWQLTIEAPGKMRWSRIIQGREGALHTGLDASLERAATLRGRVLTPEKRPASGVQVAWTAPYSERRLTVVTDASGRFVIDHLSPGTYRLQALRPNGDISSQQVQLDNLEPRDVELVLRKRGDPSVLRVRVLTEGGKPVPGATVSLGGGVRGITDAQGRWHTDEVSPFGGSVAPRAEWKGRYYSGPSVGRPFPAEAVISIPDAELWVLHPPKANPLVVLRRVGQDPRESDNMYIREPVAEGTHFAGLEAGPWTVWLRYEDGRFGTARVDLSKGERRKVAVKLSAGSSLSGRVVDERTHAPLAGVEVETAALMLRDNGLLRESVGQVRTTTDEAGRFTLAGVVPGRCVLELNHPEHDDRRFLVTAPARGTADVGELALRQGHPRNAKERMFWPAFWTRAEPEGARVMRVQRWGPELLSPGQFIIEVNGQSAKGLGGEELEALLDLREPAELMVVEEPGSTPERVQLKPRPRADPPGEGDVTLPSP
uniref:Uncharacterized protein n=1 Tax=Vitiosangium cumulatum TaxID=1867796 RepID=A0A7D4XJ56_9BACT|nr:hypothetical protein [Vitiosangium cumulatum]